MWVDVDWGSSPVGNSAPPIIYGQEFVCMHALLQFLVPLYVLQRISHWRFWLNFPLKTPRGECSLCSPQKEQLRMAWWELLAIIMICFMYPCTVCLSSYSLCLMLQQHAHLFTYGWENSSRLVTCAYQWSLGEFTKSSSWLNACMYSQMHVVVSLHSQFCMSVHVRTCIYNTLIGIMI